VFSLSARVFRRVKIPGAEPEKTVRRFLAAGKDIYYEMPVQIFEILTAAPFETRKK
jgi:hypothetical protein